MWAGRPIRLLITVSVPHKWGKEQPGRGRKISASKRRQTFVRLLAAVVVLPGGRSRGISFLWHQDPQIVDIDPGQPRPENEDVKKNVKYLVFTPSVELKLMF